MRTGIATVSLSGLLAGKLEAIAAAGFDGVEIFDQDLVASPLSPATQKTIFFFFVFGFAAIRLWGTLVILTFALRESYRRDAPTKNPA